MGFHPHYLLDLLVAGFCIVLILVMLRWTRELGSRRRRPARFLLTVSALFITCGAALAIVRIARYFPNDVYVALRGSGIASAAATIWAFIVVFVLRRVPPPVDHGRRRAIQLTAAAALAVPTGLAGFAYLRRDALTYREVDVYIPGLPKDLQGLRLVQLSDIHLSPLVSESLLARAVGMANEARASIAVVTGDLVTRVGDPLDSCLKHLARLRSDVGIYGCLGNHEIYAGAESYTTDSGARLGLRFLRGEAQQLRFGAATLNLVGVDYQRRDQEYLRGAGELIVPGATNILLSHNPDVFPVAASQKYDLTLSGHTHGGQVNLEIIHPRLNIARFFTPYVDGLYETGGRSVFVTRGIGTIGVPARLGAPPEIAMIRLCAT